MAATITNFQTEKPEGHHVVYRRQMSYSESLEEVSIKDGTSDIDRNRNGQVRSESFSSPKKLERKSKFSGLSRLFKPWKWKRRKKSDKILETAVDLERKISMRATREELVRKGVLQADLVNEPEESKITERDDDNDVIKTCDDDADATEKKVDEPEHHEMVTENGVTCADVNIITSHGDATALNKASIGLGPEVSRVTQAEINSSFNNSTTASITASQTSMRPVIITTVPSSAPPPYSPVHAHIIVPSNSHVTVDITNSIRPIHSSTISQNPSGDTAQVIVNAEPHHPYVAVPASEPDFSRIPRKSALKTRNDVADFTNQNSPRASPRPMPIFPQDDDSPSMHGSLPRSSTGPTFGGIRVLPPSQSPQQSPKKPVPKPRVTVGFSENKENVPLVTHIPDPAPPPSYGEDQPDYDNIHDSDSSDSDDIQYRDDLEDSNSLAAKVARQDSLARFLSNRPTRRELVEKNIIPTRTESEKMDEREIIGNKLIRRLSLRPTHEELHQRNILHVKSNEEQKTLMDEKKKFLIRKLSFRPSVEELRERKIIRFNDYIEVSHAHEYDRRADKPWTRLTPHDKATIRQELNEFKESEMDVHKESRHLTRFHRP